MKPHIAYTKPSISDRELAYATDAAANGWGPRCYEYIQKFESAFASYVGVSHAIATSSCTGALHMGLAALGIGPGDEVILADTNWIASVAPICHLGATPVFVDIDPISLCLDPTAVECAITSRTRAIIAVHIYGNFCDMVSLSKIAEANGIILIEDSAEAIGSSCEGRVAGSIGRFGTFSFHGTKTMTTGEGGMFVTNDAELFETVMTLSNHGRARGQMKQFWPDVLGFKYKMSNIQAAIGLAQTERIEELISRKRAILAGYRDRLGHLPGITLNPEPPNVTNGAWMPTAVFSPEVGIKREMLQTAFSENNIDARVVFWPLSSLNMFDACPENRYAWDIPTRAINLPSFHDMVDEDLDRVAAVIEGLYRIS